VLPATGGWLARLVALSGNGGGGLEGGDEGGGGVAEGGRWRWRVGAAMRVQKVQEATGGGNESEGGDGWEKASLAGVERADRGISREGNFRVGGGPAPAPGHDVSEVD
jgi:hypothetical protein